MNLKHNEILKKAIYSLNCPNLIIYSHKDIDKLNIIISILKDINNIPLKIIKDKITWKSNPVYKIFNLEYITNKNISYFFIILNELIYSKNFYLKDHKRIIIFNNFNKISYNLQTRLRVIIEKYRLTTIFIFITNNFTSILEPIKSRCLCIRIPALSTKEKRKLSKGIIKELSYNKKTIIYDKIYELNNNNEIKFYSEFNEGLFLNYKTIYEIIYKKILRISQKDKLIKKDIEDIREIAYNIQKYNLYDIYQGFLSLFIIDPKYTFITKIKIIKLFGESEYNYQKSYRSLIHIENLFIQFLHLLNLSTRNNKIDGYE